MHLSDVNAGRTVTEDQCGGSIAAGAGRLAVLEGSVAAMVESFEKAAAALKWQPVPIRGVYAGDGPAGRLVGALATKAAVLRCVL